MSTRIAIPLGGTDWGKSGIGTYVRSTVPRMARLLADVGGSGFVFGNRQELDAYGSTLDGIEQVARG